MQPLNWGLVGCSLYYGRPSRTCASLHHLSPQVPRYPRGTLSWPLVFLSTEIAEISFAQIQDGLPLAEVVDDGSSNLLRSDHPIFKHTELSPKSLPIPSQRGSSTIHEA